MAGCCVCLLTTCDSSKAGLRHHTSPEWLSPPPPKIQSPPPPSPPPIPRPPCRYVSDPAGRDPHTGEQTRLAADSDAVRAWAGAGGTGGSGAPYHFMCEAFFLAAHGLRLGLLKTLVGGWMWVGGCGWVGGWCCSVRRLYYYLMSKAFFLAAHGLRLGLLNTLVGWWMWVGGGFFLVGWATVMWCGHEACSKRRCVVLWAGG